MKSRRTSLTWDDSLCSTALERRHMTWLRMMTINRNLRHSLLAPSADTARCQTGFDVANAGLCLAARAGLSGSKKSFIDMFTR